jgi:hypothetical protein
MQMSNRTNLRAGDRVRVVAYSWRDSPTLYEIREIEGYRCTISEVLTDGRLCAPQPFDVSMLEKAAA